MKVVSLQLALIQVFDDMLILCDNKILMLFDVNWYIELHE